MLSALKASTAGIAARTLAVAAELFARSLKLRYEGIAIASRMPKMMMTTRSSMRVKPLSSPASRCRILLVMQVLLPWDERTNEVAFLHRPYPPRRVTLERVIPVFWHRWRTKKGAVSRALGDSIKRGLRADSGDDVGAGALLVPGPAADGARDAVGDRVGRRD